MKKYNWKLWLEKTYNKPIRKTAYNFFLKKQVIRMVKKKGP